jgi:Glycosyl hydrolase family 65 central catalytic domain
MGTDEYHDRYPGADRPGLNDNAYTNVMAAWVLSPAYAVLDVLPNNVRRRVCERLAVTGQKIADSLKHHMLLSAERARFNAQLGRGYLGPCPCGPAGIVGRLHGSARDRRGRHPGRDDARSHPPRRWPGASMPCSTATQASRCGDLLWLEVTAHTASALPVLLRYGGNRWPSGWKRTPPA